MDLLEILKNTGRKKEFSESANYYYEKHICTDGNEKKVMLDYILSSELADDIIRFGSCPDCGRVFYHRDYSSKSF